jgi:hypothetical protein
MDVKEWHLDIECEWLLPEEELAALEDLSAALAQAWSRYPGGSLEEEDRSCTAQGKLWTYGF